MTQKMIRTTRGPAIKALMVFTATVGMTATRIVIFVVPGRIPNHAQLVTLRTVKGELRKERMIPNDSTGKIDSSTN